MPANDLTRIWGARLAERRTAQGLTTAALAALVGVSRQQVWKLERGEHAPTDALRIRIATALDTSVPELFPHEPPAAA